MVVAVVALVLAATGTAIAAGAGVSGDRLIKKGTLSGNRLRDHTVTGKQIKESTLGIVPTARHATSADTATNAGHATTASTATDAGTISGTPLSGITARAYGFVDSAGNIDTTRSKNIASVTLSGTSNFCIVPSSASGIDPTKEFPVVMADEDPTTGSPNIFHVAELDSSAQAAHCPNGWPVRTFTILPTGPALQAVNFTLIAP
jgi:hypothetical protein